MFRTSSPSPSLPESLDSSAQGPIPSSSAKDAVDDPSTVSEVTDVDPSRGRNGRPSTGGEEEASPNARKSSKKAKSNVFTRVFKSGDAALATNAQYRRRGSIEHNRSDSTDLLYPLVTRNSQDIDRPRSQTPPAKSRLVSPTMSPPSSYSNHKNKKTRRPLSLTLPRREPPPTVNNLDAETRSDLLRKNRKLQQVLGNDYYAGSNHRSVKSEDSSSSKSSLSKKSGKRSAAAHSDGVDPNVLPQITSSDLLLSQSIDRALDKSSKFLKKPSSRPPTHRSRSYSVSSPISPSSFLDEPVSPSTIENNTQLLPLPGVSLSVTAPTPTAPTTSIESTSDTINTPTAETIKNDESFLPDAPPTATTASFDLPSTLDLSDDESQIRTGRTIGRKSSWAHVRSSSSPPITPTLLNTQLPHGRSYSISTISTMSSEAAAALERKKKRERLVKLHRFLGSNVPAEMVLGVNPPGEEGLPAPAPKSKRTLEREDSLGGESLDSKNLWNSKKWRGRRRSDSGLLDLDSLGRRERIDGDEPMTEHDRVLNVRRKAKMEKMFGANPPQGLYLTRSTSESSHGLENAVDDTEEHEDMVESADEDEDQTVLRSLEFLRHRHSLISLTYLVDKDDREQLENLFNELANEDSMSDEDEEEITFAPAEGIEDESDLEDDRPSIRFKKVLARRELQRQSMPPRSPSFRGSDSHIGSGLPSPSTVRFSAFSVASPAVEPTENDFQARRRRAAKLTKFFGTDYRSLFGEVLDSIESGVREDQKRGSLSAAEAQELLSKLRKLKAKQSQITFN